MHSIRLDPITGGRTCCSGSALELFAAALSFPLLILFIDSGAFSFHHSDKKKNLAPSVGLSLLIVPFRFRPLLKSLPCPFLFLVECIIMGDNAFLWSTATERGATEPKVGAPPAKRRKVGSAVRASASM